MTGRDEHGFTLIELLATIVILSVVMAPLTVGFMQALNFVPDASQRTTMAVNRSAMIDRFNEDVNSATSVTQGAVIATCPAAVPVATDQNVPIYTISRSYDTGTTTTIKWFIDIPAAATATNGAAPMVPVNVVRSVYANGSPTATETRTLFSAYCALGGLVFIAFVTPAGQGGLGGPTNAAQIGQHPLVNLAVYDRDSTTASSDTTTLFTPTEHRTCTGATC